MRKQLLVLGLVAGLAALIQFGCRGGTASFESEPGSGGLGSVALFGGDAPLCHVVSFEVTIIGMTLHPQGGGDPVSVVSSGDAITVDFAALMGFSTLLKFANVPAGTYTQATLTLSNPKITVLDVKQDPPAPVAIDTTLSTATVTVNISPALVVRENQTVGLDVDFNLLKSVLTDDMGQVTGVVNPLFRVSPTVISDQNILREIDDIHGVVLSVDTTSSDPAFVGSFTIRTLWGRERTVYVTSQTEFEGVSGLGELTPGTFVEVEGYVDTNRNLVATEVEVEDVPNLGMRRAAFVGIVTKVERDAAEGNATQFVLFIREHHPNIHHIIPLRTRILVRITSETRFKVVARGTNYANLSFDAKSLGEGQSVVVHGTFTLAVPPLTMPTLDARHIFLRLQTVVGNYDPTGPKVVGSDGKTGGFTLVPCSPLFRGNPIVVLTFPQTAFAGLKDLNGLDPKPLLAVKGLLFFEQTDGSVNDMPWKAPAYVQVAKRVRQLPN